MSLPVYIFPSSRSNGADRSRWSGTQYGKQEGAGLISNSNVHLHCLQLMAKLYLGFHSLSPDSNLVNNFFKCLFLSHTRQKSLNMSKSVHKLTLGRKDDMYICGLSLKECLSLLSFLTLWSFIFPLIDLVCDEYIFHFAYK